MWNRSKFFIQCQKFFDGRGAEFDEDSEPGLGLMIGAQILNVFYSLSRPIKSNGFTLVMEIVNLLLIIRDRGEEHLIRKLFDWTVVILYAQGCQRIFYLTRRHIWDPFFSIIPFMIFSGPILFRMRKRWKVLKSVEKGGFGHNQLITMWQKSENSASSFSGAFIGIKMTAQLVRVHFRSKLLIVMT